MNSKNSTKCIGHHISNIQAKFMKAVFACLLVCLITPLYGATPWLHVEGNQIKDPAGNQVVLRGVAIEDLGCVAVWRDGVENLIDRLTDETDTQGSSPGWYTRVVRLAVYPADQPDYSGPWYFDDDPDDYYNNLLRPAVDYCKSKGLYVIIDWHYITTTSSKVAQTSAFWEYIAPRFADDSHVIFELFNEPTDSSWPVVKANMQTWIDIVRSYAPNNLILVGGPQWCQILTPQITDPVGGDNIVYVAHLYPAHWYGGVWQIDVDGVADCAAVHPVMMTEWGFISPGSTLFDGTISSYGQPLMDFLELHKIGNTAWCADYDWYPPMFYSNWTLRCGEGEMGCFVKDTLYLRRNDDQPSPGDLYRVDADANGTNDGSSWENAFNYLQDALAAVTSSAEIQVAEGIYKPDEDTAHPDGSGDRAAAFQLKNYVTIKGGYAGFGAANPNKRDQDTYETILSGDLNGDDCPDFANNSENSYHVVTASGVTNTAVLDGFTITAGNADGGDWYHPNFWGGGMFNDQSSPTITNCTFSNNSAEYCGGGMANKDNSNPTVTNCIFSKNSANIGGGIYSYDNSSPTLTNCVFSSNSAGRGGGMYNNRSYPMLTNCVFSNNLARYDGGGIFNRGSSPTITNCTFSGNQADSHGGGLANGHSNPTLTNCTFIDNSAVSQGGGMFNFYNSSQTVTNCILWGNTAPEGSQIHNEGTSSAIVTYSDVQDSWPGEGNIDEDPCFVAPDSNDFRLLPASPCIDAGDNAAVPPGVTTDLDGNPRIRGPAVDMGVYESPAVLFVDADAIGANDGSSWEDAFNHLQDALNVTWWVDEIRVAEGVYKPDEDTAHPDGSGSRAAAFRLKTGMVIKGAYAGYGQPDPDARDIKTYETILSGDLSGNDGPDFANNAENSYHVVIGSGTTSTAVLDGFTITAGNADSGDWYNSDFWGGGMLNEGGSPTITNCTFSRNSSVGPDFGYGGGLCNLQSSPIITNCIFSDNRAAYYGGGLFNYYNSSPTITNCIFSGNSAQQPDNGYGGGMCNFLSSPTLTNCILWDNTALFGQQIYNFMEEDNPSVTYTDVQDGYSGAGNINADPCFVDANSNDYHLLAVSPCINAGDPNYVPGPNETDLDGLPRVIGARIDMGPYEFNHQPVAVAGPNQVAYAWLDGFADVNLDGSGSFDDDNDILDYYWSWTINGNTHEANGVSPTIELPVGNRTIELVVDDGIDLSDPDYCTITVIKAVRGTLMLSPRVLQTKSCGKWVIATLFIPSVPGEEINANEPLRLYPGGIEAKYQRFSKYRRFRRSYTVASAFFDKKQVADALGAGWFKVDVAGEFLSGRYFFGSDTIKIIAPKPKPPHWWHWWWHW